MKHSQYLSKCCDISVFESVMRYSNRRLIKDLSLFVALAAAASVSSRAIANDIAENSGWQFQTSTDKANTAAVKDMILRKRGGYYSTPTYTTNIDHQYNCTISAAATGNQGTTSAVANSPSTSGATATSTGNNNDSDIDGFGSASSGSAVSDNTQSNSGVVGARVTGSTSTRVRGTADQILNSTQTNSGAQTASVQGASGCSFAGPLN